MILRSIILIKMNTKTIRQSLKFRASPHDIYETLMDSEKHSLLTGDTAEISREINGRFTAFGGYSQGVNLELVPDKKIVLTWRAGDWPEGHYSEVAFLLKETGNGTEVEFTQSGVPEEQYDDIYQGWYDYYWQPMKKMVEK